MKKMRNDNKGFTLVEMIVVLVILAILAAILVPALLGYIDEAKQKQLELHGKSVYTAAQGIVSKVYAKNSGNEINSTNFPEAATVAGATKYSKDILDLADVASFNPTKGAKIVIGFKDISTNTSANKHDIYTVNYVFYKEDGSDGVELLNGEWKAATDVTSDTSVKNKLTILNITK